MNKLRVAALLFATFFVSPALVWAQTGSITGVVKDPTGAVIAGTTVTATNMATNAQHVVSTNSVGLYTIPQLAPASYALTAQMAGFKAYRVQNLTLTTSQVLTVDITLEVGAVAESVEVSGQSVAPIDLETAQLSNLVSEQTITELPLILRDPYQLIGLSPGVVSTNALGGFAVNGSNERHNNFLLDGTDNNDTSVPGNASGVTTLNPDTTQEFRVITNNFLPEYGRNTGAIIDIVTKSGTNDFHGNLYWFGRYAALAARDFFDQTSDPSPFVRNQFGGSLGGPIVKDRTFFFFNGDYSRFSTTRASSGIVPSQAFKNGFVTFVDPGTNQSFTVNYANPADPGNLFGLGIDPSIAAVLATYPDPNGPAVDANRGVFFFNQNSRDDSDNYTLKIDHNFTPNHRFSARYSYNKFDGSNPFFIETLPGLDGVSSLGRGQNWSLGLLSTFKPTLLNELRFGANRVRAEFACTSVDLVDSLSPGGLDVNGRGRDLLFPGGLAQFGCTNLGDANGQARYTGTYQYKDNLTWIKGNHVFKMGGEFRFIYDNGFTDFFSREQLSFNNRTTFGSAATAIDFDPGTAGIQQGNNTLQDLVWMMYGIVDQQAVTQAFNAAGQRQADDLRGLRQREFAVFWQDSWKALSNLTIDYGIRYEWYGVPFEVHNNLSNLFADPAGVPPGCCLPTTDFFGNAVNVPFFTFETVGPGTGRMFYNNDNDNFMPRLGIAWDPFKTGKTSIRAGYGIFFDRAFSNLFGNAATGNPPFVQAPLLFQFDSVQNLGFIPTATPSPDVKQFDFFVPVLFEPNFQMPYSQNWNVGIQQELGWDTSLEVNYAASKGTHLFRVYNGNFPQPDLVQALINAGVPESQLQFNALYFNGDIGAWPFDAVNNNALFVVFQNSSQATSTYNALQVNLTKRMSHGFQIQSAFTWSHAIDWASDPLAPTTGNNQLPRDSSNIKASELGNSDFDVRRNLVINYIWELPVGKGTDHLRDGAVGKLLEGWTISGVTRFSDGVPYDACFGSIDSSHSRQVDRCDLLASPNTSDTSQAGVDPRTQTGPTHNMFSEPAAFGRVGTLQRNAFNIPGINNFDVLIGKKTSIGEGVSLEFRAEFYNLFNRVQFGTPQSTFTSPGTFGQSLTQVGRPDGTSGARQIQFGLKLLF